MRTKKSLIIAATLCLFAISFAAAEPAEKIVENSQRAHETEKIVADMTRALEPERRSLRTIEIVVRGPDGAEVSWSARQARRALQGGQGIITALLVPESVRGFAWLAKRDADGIEKIWMYMPPVRRVREMVGVDRFQSFLGSDFSLGDLALFETAERQYEHVGDEKIDSVLAHKVVERLQEPTPYARIETWVSIDRHFPIVRKYYDRGGELWKVATFSEVTVIDGVPTVLRATIKDVQAGGESELRVSEVQYDAEVAEKLFDPSALASAAAAME